MILLLRIGDSSAKRKVPKILQNKEECKQLCTNSFAHCSLCGNCALLCPTGAREIAGKEYSINEVIEEILKDTRLYESSGGGVTFSGGECMLQIDFLKELLKKCKELGLHTAVDTAGHFPFEKFEQILPYTDLFLYDIKCFDSEKHKQYTGVGNQLILENLKILLTTNKSVWVRIPIIPTVNDTAQEMQRIKKYISSCGNPEKIELLPYHAIGNSKYEALNKKAPIFPTPSEEKMRELNAIFN